MPRTTLMLGLLVLCVVTPWTDAVSVDEVNGTVSLASEHVEVNREYPEPLSMGLDTVSRPTLENEREEINITKSMTRRTIDQPKEKLTGFETEVACDNAQFLMKILTVILPLLRNEVPESTRTSYILYILKDLLKSSPEAARDHDIMFKINDLLVTLEKFHNKDLGSGSTNHNTLRQLSPASNSNGVRSKVVFQYEVPQLANPDCTAELLKIIKIVQQAILRLVNNPLCKSHIPEEMPLLLDVKEYFVNPKLYYFDKKKPTEDLPAEELKLPSEHILDIDIPIQADMLDKKPFYPYTYNNHTGTEDQSNYYDKTPFKQKPLHSEVPKYEPFYIYPEYPKSQKLINSPYSYEIFPSMLSVMNGSIDKPKYTPLSPEQPYSLPYIIDQFDSSVPSASDVKLPTIKQTKLITTPVSQFDVIDGDVPNRPNKNPYKYLPKDDNFAFDASGENFGKFEIDKTKSYPLYEFDLPSNHNKIKQYRPNPIYKNDLKYPTRPLPSLDIYGDDGSAEVKIGQHKPKWLIKKLKFSSFDVDSSPDSADISQDQYPNNPNLHFIHPGLKPKENPYKFHTSPHNLPTERGVPVFPNNRLKPPYSPYLSKDSSNKISSKPGPYNPYFLKPDYDQPTQSLKPFDVTGDGSGEIQLGSTETPIPNGIELFVPKPKTNLKYPYEYYQPRYPPKEKENVNSLPEYYGPQEGEDVRPEILTDFYVPNKDSFLISDHITNSLSRPNIENQYTVPETIMPYEEIPVPNELFPDSDISQNVEPKLWNSNNIPIEISPQPHLVPDDKILLIIKDNIDVMEAKIPKEHLNTQLREIIRKLKDLLDLKLITIEEYINIINQYQMLVEYIKRLNISNAIMNELFLSMTNVDKLDMLPGNSQVIELTYLIKRPKPLVYQPYYYIKYQLPYTSFIARVERLLTAKPYLKNNPAQLYKELISISKVAETSPDLKKYDKKDIFRLTFNKGTLVGSKLVKGTDMDMYNTLDRLKSVNSDLTLEGVYELIKNLDSQLKHTSEGLILENNNIPGLNILTQTDEIHIIKPFLRSNTSTNYTENGSDVPLNSDTDKTNDSVPSIGRTRDAYDLNQLRNGYSFSYEPLDYAKNFKTNTKTYLPDDYQNILKKNLNYYTGKNSEVHGLKNKDSDMGLDLNEMYSNPIQYAKKVDVIKDDQWWNNEINAYDKNPESYKSKSVDLISIPFESSNTDSHLTDYSMIVDSEIPPQQQLNPNNAAKLLETTLKADKNYKHDYYIPQQYHIKSSPASISNDDAIAIPDPKHSHLVKHSKTYINGIPVEHSKSYIIENSKNEVQQFETSYKDPGKYNVQNSQSFIDPYVGNYAKPSPSEDIKLQRPQSAIINFDKYNAVKDTQSLTNGGSHSDIYKFADKLIQTQDANLVQKPQTYNENSFNTLYQNQALIRGNPNTRIQQQNMANNMRYYGNGLAQNQAYLGGNLYTYNQHYNLPNNLGNLGVYNQNLHTNQMTNSGHRYWINQRRPLMYQFNRSPRTITHPILG